MDSQLRIFFTGGSGFFGRALLRYWLACSVVPSQVTVMSRNPVKFLGSYPEFSRTPWLSFHRGDVLHRHTFPLEGEFTHFLHAATDSTFGPNLTPLERYTQIVDGTRNALDFCVERKIARFLLISSGGVYGSQPADMHQIPEDYCGIPEPLNARNAYSIAKRTAEHLCILYRDSYGVDTIIARCFAFVGRDLPLDAHFAIGNFIYDALYSTAIKVAGNGTAIRSYLDQHDLAVWLTTIMLKGNSGSAYNVGSDQGLSIKELAELVREIISPEKRIEILSESSAIGADRTRYLPDISRARRELDLKVTVALDEAIKHTASAHR